MLLSEQYPIYESTFPDSIPPLFHYTSTSGLLGMLNFKSIWFTQFSFSNDTAESSYAREVISEVMKEYPRLHFPDTLTYSPDPDPAKDLSALDLPLVFSFSLSAAGDDLSQWRGYCPNGGYAIRFDPQQLNAMLQKEQLLIGKCVYDLEDQKQFIRERIIGYPKVEDYENAREQYSGTRWAVETSFDIRERAVKYAPLIKASAFAHEQEWKIFKSYNPTRHWGPGVHQRFLMRSTGLLSKMEFREGKGTLIPYLRIPLIGNEQLVHLPEVIISPTPNQTLARAACQFLLDKQVVFTGDSADTSGTAKNSTIPYRNW
jgi:hypothetical protein